MYRLDARVPFQAIAGGCPVSATKVKVESRMVFPFFRPACYTVPPITILMD
jgi:predicted secreted Zn-dependent protease